MRAPRTPVRRMLKCENTKTMREFINLTTESRLSLTDQATKENYPHNATDSFVADMVSRLHTRSSEDALNWVCKYKTYNLKQIPLNEIDIIHSSSEQDKINKYADMDTNPPPIVVDGETGWIIDGYHRARASELRGMTHILAYVGDELNEEWWEDQCDNY